jgi:hypothetical protein
METIKFKITGTRPLLVHADTLADPLNPMTRPHKEMTSKRKKTDEDHEAIARSEWRASLYFDSEIGPYIPGVNIEASIIAGAKLSKLGAQIKRSIEVLEDKCKLEYAGPRSVEKLWAEGFYDVRGVKVQSARLMRYRPLFRQWASAFTLIFDPESINRDQVIKCVQDAGEYCGLGDYRPKFGRFRVEVAA